MGRGPRSALTRRAFRDARVRTVSFASLFAAVSYIQPVTYRHTYPTRLDRLGFARSFGDNKAIRLFYGVPHDLLSTGGYTAWRAGGTLVIFAAVYGMLGAVRALRAEEEAGRSEIVLSGILGRRSVFCCAMAAVAAGTLLLSVAAFAGLLLGGLPAGNSAYLVLAIICPAPVFAGIGAVASQLAPTRRGALELGLGALALAFLLRVVADTASAAGWLRWLTPLGWAEELRPFASVRPLVLLAPIAATSLLLALALRIDERRDIGTGVLAARDEREPRLGLLGSPTAFALRSERGTLLVWAASIGTFAFILGVISESISAAGISSSLRRALAKFGTSVLTPQGYLGFSFIFFVLALSLFAVAQVGAARHEEADEQLETLLAQPVSRSQWLSGRLALAGLSAAVLALVAGVLAWAGAASAGVGISLPRMLEAAGNLLPVPLLFLGLAALLYALTPRASAGISYGLVAVAFLWELFGALLGAPRWLVDLSPFEHVASVPAQAFRPGSALVMVAIGAAAGVGALVAFRRRDLLGA